MNNSVEDNRIIFAVIRIFFSIVLIIISLFVLRYIFLYIINYPFFDDIKVRNNATNISISVETATSKSMFINDNKGLSYKKEDRSFAREEWIEKNGELFYFDTSSYGLSGNMKLNGQIYTFEKGKLKRIRRDTGYSSRVNEELFNSIDSVQYLIYLDDAENRSGSFPIKYLRYSDDLSDYLGTKDDKQYSTQNLLNINGNDIYYLSLSGDDSYRGKLFRMRPNAQKKESVGLNVEGYILLSNDIVYYYDGNVIMKAKNWIDEGVKFINEEDIFSDALNSVPISDNKEIIPIDVDIEKNKDDLNNSKVEEYNGNTLNNNEKNDLTDKKIVILDRPMPIDSIKSPISEIETRESTRNDGPVSRENLPIPLPISRD